MKLNFLRNLLITKIIRNNLLNITFFYNRAKFINKILKTGGLKEIYLIILIKLISKLYKNRLDYFDVKILLNGIYDQYKLRMARSSYDLQPLSDGLYLNYDSRRIDENIKLYKHLLEIEEDKRTYQFQSFLNILEHKLYGTNKDWHKFKKKLTQLGSTNYPIINKNELFLGPNWYEAIGHIALLGYLAKIYPNKFTLIMVDGAKIANVRLLNIIKPRLKIVKTSPLIFNSLLISQPEKIFLVDDTRFCEDKDPAIELELINKWNTKSKNKYRLRPNLSSLKDILDSSEIINHDLKPEFITLHVRSALNVSSNINESSVRNANIFSYIETIKFLIKNNINVVRIGDLNSPKLPYINGFIDLTMKERDLNKDLDLLVNAKFHIATLSGPMNVPPLFGVPILLTNSVRPHIQPLFPQSLQINKRCLNKKNKTFLPHEAFIKSKMVNEEMKRDFGDFTLIDNTPEEILYGVQDMLRLTSYKSNEIKKREYQEICKQYKKYLESKSLDHLNPHLPIAPSFLKNIE